MQSGLEAQQNRSAQLNKKVDELNHQINLLKEKLLKKKIKSN